MKSSRLFMQQELLYRIAVVQVEDIPLFLEINKHFSTLNTPSQKLLLPWHTLYGNMIPTGIY